MEQFTEEYCLNELVEFRKLMGTKPFWEMDYIKHEWAIKGLYHCCANSENSNKNFSVFKFIMDEYEQRRDMIKKHGIN